MELISSNEIVEDKEEIVIIKNPKTREDLYKVEFNSTRDIETKLTRTWRARKSWSEQTMKSRVKILHKYRFLLERDRDKLIQLVMKENGKLYHEANAEVEKALELTEFALSIPSLLTGKTEYVSKGVEVKEYIDSVGIALIITPFNFPLMIPHWNMLNALITGNAVFIKPSTQTPATIYYIYELLMEAGLPDFLFNVIYGEEDTVNYMIRSTSISMVTFVGSSPVAKKVYETCGRYGKRCLALGGAKNHTIITKDVDFDKISNEVIESAFGMSGQRCMATSILSLVGDCDELIKLICSKLEHKTEFAAIITDESARKLKRYVDKTEGQILVNGIPSEPSSNSIRPTIIMYENEEIPDEEIFGPVLEVQKFKSVEDAIYEQNISKYGNGATIYTDNGYIAEVASQLGSGMIGVNIGVPVPREPFGFGGLKTSKYGYGEISGLNSLEFWINRKRITTKWNYQNKIDWTS